jgi:hypothetical protein
MRKQRRRVLGGAVAIAFATVAVLALSALPAGAWTTPTNLAATTCGSHVTLTWSPVGRDSYVVYRSTSQSSGYTQIGTPTSATYTDTDPGLLAGTTYYYEVASHDSAGTSSPSSPVSVKVSSAACGQVPIGAIGAIPVALLLGGVLVYHQHRRRIRRQSTAAAS